jgi:hypothetical protein
MFIDLGMGLTLTEEQFQAEMAKRREKMKQNQQDVFIGCPLCNVPPRATTTTNTTTSAAPTRPGGER